jgi:hypothetical protein
MTRVCAIRLGLVLIVGVSPLLTITSAASAPKLFEWERGFGLQAPDNPGVRMFLWIYEWNMFEAMTAGQHTKGTYDLRRRLAPDGREAVAEAPQFQLTLRPVEDGAEMILRITNRTAHAWPETAGIIPCWNPGQVPGTNPSMPKPANPNFSDPWRRNTYYLSAGGLTPLDSRAIHFNAALRTAVDRSAEDGRFAWSNKWPTSEADAWRGLMVRESEDGRWVTAIAWEDFVSVQGHNPWYCLHNCVRVGPLQPGESRNVRGRLYLFPGDKEECLARFRRDFPAR